MKTYGRRNGDDDEDFFVPTRKGKQSPNNRQEGKRLMHKQGRRDGKKHDTHAFMIDCDDGPRKIWAEDPQAAYDIAVFNGWIR